MLCMSRLPIAHVVLTASLASVALTGLAQESRTPLPASTCASLQGFSIPALAIGLPTGGAVVQTAVAVTASEQGNTNGDFCKVVGIVRPQHAGSPNLEFEVPEGITFAEIDRDTGKLATPGCPRTYNEAFLAGTEPVDYCELHRW